jgi:hypothetical protein
MARALFVIVIDPLRLNWHYALKFAPGNTEVTDPSSLLTEFSIAVRAGPDRLGNYFELAITSRLWVANSLSGWRISQPGTKLHYLVESYRVLFPAKLVPAGAAQREERA